MTIDMSQFYEEFFEETEELLTEMERLLLGIDAERAPKEEIDAIFRTAHSIKGGAATFGMADIADVTHVLESLLDRIRRGEMALTASHVDVFLAAKDSLVMLADGHRHGTPVDEAAVEMVRNRLEALAEVDTQAGKVPIVSKPAEGDARLDKTAKCFRIVLPDVPVRDADTLAGELGLMGTVDTEQQADGRCVFRLTTHESLEDILAVCAFVLDPDSLTVSEVPASDVRALASRPGIAEEGDGYGFFEPLEAAGQAAAGQAAFPPASRMEKAAGQASSHKTAPERPASLQDSASIRVSVEKIDQLINLVGELVITQAMIQQRTGDIDPTQHERLLSSVNQLARNTRDLQESVMSIRMMPMDYAFTRFPRMVRDLASKLGKKVEFVTRGGATELDRGLIEKIIDPLTHLVRNSIDHGIESPEMRLAAGKPEAGRVCMSAAHQGGNILIEVSDDGSGLQRERILAKAKQQGMSVSDNLSDQDVWRLIFAPGFSTAEKVTDISGRGVGMDVVQRNISALGGTIDIRSVSGEGTAILISLPLTLAILDGMSIKVGDEVYIVPLNYVVECLQPASEDIREMAGEGRVVKVRGEYLPVISLYQAFDIVPFSTDPSDGILVILETDGRQAALLIDELVGQQQIVVKNLEANYRRVAGISGATILGDGSVALILDVPALLRSSRRTELQAAF